MAFRYPDRFRNTLMASHSIATRAEVWYPDTPGGPYVKQADLPLSDGAVTGDRAGVVRRTFTGTVDPDLTPRTTQDLLNPFGPIVKLWRGITYSDNTSEVYQVFTGRIDKVDIGTRRLSITCSDLGAQVADSDFEKPFAVNRGTLITTAMKDIIEQAMGVGYPILIAPPAESASLTTPSPRSCDGRRSDSLNDFALTLGCEWWADEMGTFRVAPLPVITPTSDPIWVVNTGDEGVMVSRSHVEDRANVYNAVVVRGEPPDGRAPSFGMTPVNNPSDPLYYGGPFGKIPRIVVRQDIYINAQAQTLANQLFATALAAVRTIDIECVVNPQLMLGNIIRVQGAGLLIDGMYFIQSFELPMTAQRTMRLTAQTALDVDVSNGSATRAKVRRVARKVDVGDGPRPSQPH